MLVLAGYDYFYEDLLWEYFYSYVVEFGIEWQWFVVLGKIDLYNYDELFFMSYLAICFLQEVNGVSELYGVVFQKMFKVFYLGYYFEEFYLGYVINFVYYLIWIVKEWNDFYLENFGNGFFCDQFNKEYWCKIYNVFFE